MSLQTEIKSGFLVPQADFPVQFSEKAYQMAKTAILASDEEPNQAVDMLRVSVRGGGCAGLQYSLDLDNKTTPYDITAEVDGLKVVCDIFSLRYLANATIEYVETLEGAGFRFNNPNARRSCGCGSSFS